MVLKLMLAAMVAVSARPRQPAAPAPAPVVAAAIDELELEPAPIRREWILRGDPQARASTHSDASDRQAMTAVWDCTAGTFRWHFDWDETVVIVEGAVHVTAEDGSERTLSAGDIAYFPAGSWATWHVEDYVRKVAFCRRQFPAPVAAALKVGDRMRRGLARVGLAA
ncbi:cupin domain-containing protein [Shinella pollutisoli]|uniref:Cupin domain-containing protein n=1 Tax=Shinella pollutisoli TaxID=2250594 RepID=A0ABV7DAV6_9HYPH|nr:cupin domain-containing protein [Shinella pollutisoli]